MRGEWRGLMGEITKGHEDTLRGDGYVHSLVCGKGLTGVYISQKLTKLYMCVVYCMSTAPQKIKLLK